MIAHLRVFVIKYQNQIVFLLIMLFALLFRILHLDSVPSGLSTSETEVLRQVNKLMNNGFLPFPDQYFDLLYLYLIAIVSKVTLFNILAIKIVQVCISLATVGLFYFFVKMWLNRKIALLAVLFFSVDFLHIILTRTINPDIFIPLMLIALLLSTTISLRENKVYWFVLTGFLAGLSFYVNQAFLLIPLVLVLSFVFFFNKNKFILSAYWKNYLAFILALLIAALPFLYLLPKNITTIIDYFNPGSVGNYLMNFGNIWSSLIYQSNYIGSINVGLEPILSPFLAITFVCGLIYTIFHLERRKYFFLTMLLIVSTFIMALIRLQNLSIFILIIPITLILASVILDYLLTAWFKTFPFNKNARFVLTVLLSIFIFLTVFYSYEKIFYAWDGNSFVQNQFTNTFDYKK